MTFLLHPAVSRNLDGSSLHRTGPTHRLNKTVQRSHGTLLFSSQHDCWQMQRWSIASVPEEGVKMYLDSSRGVEFVPCCRLDTDRWLLFGLDLAQGTGSAGTAILRQVAARWEKLFSTVFAWPVLLRAMSMWTLILQQTVSTPDHIWPPTSLPTSVAE